MRTNFSRESEGKNLEEPSIEKTCLPPHRIPDLPQIPAFQGPPDAFQNGVRQHRRLRRRTPRHNLVRRQHLRVAFVVVVAVVHQEEVVVLPHRLGQDRDVHRRRLVVLDGGRRRRRYAVLRGLGNHRNQARGGRGRGRGRGHRGLVVEVGMVPEIRRGGFVLRQGGEDAEAALRLREALVEVVEAVAMAVVVARSR